MSNRYFFSFLAIHSFHIDHNVTCLLPSPLPPNFAIPLSSISLGATVIPKGIENNGYAKFGRRGGGGGVEVRETRCIMVYVDRARETREGEERPSLLLSLRARARP